MHKASDSRNQEQEERQEPDKTQGCVNEEDESTGGNVGTIPAALRSILVEVYPGMTDDLTKKLFVEINKSEPVKLVDLPDLGAKEDEQRLLTFTADKLQRAFPDMFKASSSCRAPHMNVDNLRDDLHQARVVHRVASVRDAGAAAGDPTGKTAAAEASEAMHCWTLALNDSLGAAGPAELRALSRVRSQGAFDKGLAKARQFGFYLGLVDLPRTLEAALEGQLDGVEPAQHLPPAGALLDEAAG